MTEDEARAWVRNHFDVSRETLLERYGELLREEAQHQNLIAASTFETLWNRHLVDSAQLVPLAAKAGKGSWLDIGSGAGLPGIVVAILTERPVVLCEPRGRRVTFLRHVADTLGLGNVEVQPTKIESYKPARPAVIVSARAVAELSKLFDAARSCTDSSTIWLLPKGRNAQTEVEAARAKWQGSFHVEQSITETDSGIVIAEGVRSK